MTWSDVVEVEELLRQNSHPDISPSTPSLGSNPNTDRDTDIRRRKWNPMPVCCSCNLQELGVMLVTQSCVSLSDAWLKTEQLSKKNLRTAGTSEPEAETVCVCIDIHTQMSKFATENCCLVVFPALIHFGSNYIEPRKLKLFYPRRVKWLPSTRTASCLLQKHQHYHHLRSSWKDFFHLVLSALLRVHLEDVSGIIGELSNEH